MIKKETSTRAFDALGLALALASLPNSFANAQQGGAFPTFPQGSAPVTISTTGTVGSISVVLPGAVGRLTSICGFVITSGGTTTAIVGAATVTGVVSGTMSFEYVAVSSGQGLLGVAFPQCIPAASASATISVTSPAGGTGTVGAVTAWGYQQ